jgi:hypothetical protein
MKADQLTGSRAAHIARQSSSAKSGGVIEDVIDKIEIADAIIVHQGAYLGDDLLDRAQAQAPSLQQRIGAVDAAERAAALGLQIGHTPFTAIAGYIKEGAIGCADGTKRKRREKSRSSGEYDSR